jgi:hypothetical protein
VVPFVADFRLESPQGASVSKQHRPTLHRAPHSQYSDGGDARHAAPSPSTARGGAVTRHEIGVVTTLERAIEPTKVGANVGKITSSSEVAGER